MKCVAYTSDMYDEVMNYLRRCYIHIGEMITWVPARFEDLVYRLEALQVQERGEESLVDRIKVFKDQEFIFGVCFWDNAWYPVTRQVSPLVWDEMLKQLSGYIMLPNPEWRLGLVPQRFYYSKAEDNDLEYICSCTLENFEPDSSVPLGFRYTMGVEKKSWDKAFACEKGFHPEIVVPQENPISYFSRQNAPMFKDCKERLILNSNDEIVAYAFTWVDRAMSYGLLEPVCVLEPYRGKGIGKALIQGILRELRQDGIETCWVYPVGEERKSFYMKCGFVENGSMAVWRN